MQRYATQGINHTLSLPEQLILWNLYDTMNISEKDYLQVFKLERQYHRNGKAAQKITHSQEVPPYSKAFTFQFTNPVDTKVFIINDTTHETMLLANEY